MKSLQTKESDNRIHTPSKINTPMQAFGPEDSVQATSYSSIDLRTRIQQKSLPWMFSRYFFSYCVPGIDAKVVARLLVDVMTRHAHVPTTIITDKSPNSGQMIWLIQHKSTTKHPQKIGFLDCRRCKNL